MTGGVAKLAAAARRGVRAGRRRGGRYGRGGRPWTGGHVVPERGGRGAARDAVPPRGPGPGPRAAPAGARPAAGAAARGRLPRRRRGLRRALRHGHVQRRLPAAAVRADHAARSRPRDGEHRGRRGVRVRDARRGRRRPAAARGPFAAGSVPLAGADRSPARRPGGVPARRRMASRPRRVGLSLAAGGVSLAAAAVALPLSAVVGIGMLTVGRGALVGITERLLLAVVAGSALLLGGLEGSSPAPASRRRRRSRS